MRRIACALNVLCVSFFTSIAADADLLTFSDPDVGGFVVNSAAGNPAFLAAIGTPDEFDSFAFRLGHAQDIDGSTLSSNVVYSTKISTLGFGGVNSNDVRCGSGEIGPVGTFDGVLNIDFLAAGNTASIVGFGPVALGINEQLRVYDQDNVLAGTFSGVSDNTFDFLGLQGTLGTLIGRIEFDGSFFAIQDIQFNLVVPEPINLDIKPGPSNNTVALNGNGTLQMAILANEEFNVMDVDIGSLLFGDPILVDGGATPLGATSDRLRDLNHDGLDDLLVGFSISDLVAGGALDASSVEGRLTGELFDGTPIFGSDIVRMVPQNNGGGGLVSSTVPEPTTSALALAALCLAISRRRYISNRS